MKEVTDVYSFKSETICQMVFWKAEVWILYDNFSAFVLSEIFRTYEQHDQGLW